MGEGDDKFVEAQDRRMQDIAEEILNTKHVSQEQNAEVVGWLVLNFLTMKKSLWSEERLDARIALAIANHKQACDAEDGDTDGVPAKRGIVRMAVKTLLSEKGLLFVIIILLLLYMSAKDGVHLGSELRQIPVSSVESGK